MAVEIQPTPPGARLTAWRWESTEASQRVIKDAISAKFPITQVADVSYEIKFQWDSEQGYVNPQAEILLQVVVDAADALLRRGAPPVRESRAGVVASMVGSRS